MISFKKTDMRVDKNCKYNASIKGGNTKMLSVFCPSLYTAHVVVLQLKDT